MLFFSVIALSIVTAVPASRVVGGTNAFIESYPYQVSIAQDGQHICGGSIISHQFILTAAHCVDLATTPRITVHSGSTYLGYGLVSKVKQIIKHEWFHTNMFARPVNDIALLLLEEPLVFDSTRQPVELFGQDEESAYGAEAIATGWGKLSNGYIPFQLQVVKIPIILKSFCHQLYIGFGGLPACQICAGYYGIGGKDTCQGDSGGPLTIGGRLAGIVSWGEGCGDSYYPGVYTEVSRYRSWIEQKISEIEIDPFASNLWLEYNDLLKNSLYDIK